MSRIWNDDRRDRLQKDQHVLFAVVFLVLAITPVRAAAPDLLSASPSGGWIVKTWGTGDGLPENSSTAMAQSADGYLWFGTFNGLVRFDGVRFTVFDQSNTPELPGNLIANLHLDSQERLWLSTERGLVFRKAAQWSPVFGTEQGWTGDFVRTFAEGGGKLFVTSFDGKVFQFDGSRFHELPSPPGVPGRGYFAHVDQAGLCHVAQHGFIGKWDGQRWVPTLPPEEYVSQDGGAGPGRNGSWWLYNREQLARVEDGKVTRRISLREAPGGEGKLPGGFWSLTEDSQGFVWIATYNVGLFRVSPAGEIEQRTSTNGLSSVSIRHVFEDREGSFWVGSSGGGLMRLKHRLLFSFGQGNGSIGLTDDPVVWAVAVGRTGEILAGMYGGGLLRLDDNGIGRVPLPGRFPNAAYVLALLVDRERRMWVGTFQTGLVLLEGEKRRILRTEESGGITIQGLLEDSRHQVWIGGDQALMVFDGKEFRRASKDETFRSVQSFSEDARTGVIWMGDSKGRLLRFEGGAFAEVRPAGDSFGGNIRTMLAERDGTLWIGTGGGGLGCLRQGTYVRLGRKGDRSPRRVGSMLLDDSGYFWLGTEQGVMRVARAELLDVADGRKKRVWWDMFDDKDYGVPTTDFATVSQTGAARDELGRFWFASVKGLSAVDPAKLGNESRPPPIRIEQLSYTDQADVTHTIALDSGALLPAGSHNIEIQFTALSFVAPTKVLFAVRTTRDGKEFSSWEGERRSAYFDWLPPGHYGFSVNAANHRGKWNPSMANASFVVLPFYWQTRWFQVLGLSLAVLVPAAIVWSVLQGRHRRAQEKLREQKFAEKRLREEHECRLRAEQEARVLSQRLLSAHEAERSRIARELHDDVTQRLARLAIDAVQSERAPDSNAARRAMREDLVQLSEDVHQLAYRLHPAILDELGLLEALRAECDRFARDQSVKVQMKPRDVPTNIDPAAALALFRVAQEALRNVAKHARARSVKVSLARLDGGLQLAVEDDGVGLDPARNGAATLGHAGMRERISLVSGELDIESTFGSGTTIVAWVPLKGTES